jgi:choline kinase
MQVEESIALAAGQGQRFLDRTRSAAKSLKNLPMADTA